MIYFSANQFNFGGNMVSYVLYDGDLYRIFIGNESTGTAQLVSKYLSSSMGAAILKKGEQDRQRDQQLLVQGSYLHTQLNKNDCWKILEVEDIVSKKDCYRIRCLIEKGRSRKQEMPGENLRRSRAEARELQTSKRREAVQKPEQE